MSWSGGSYTKGNAATGGWAGDASLGIGIEASRHDTQDNDFATGINQCVNKDGSNAFTGNPNLGGYIPTNLGAGTAGAPALCVGNDVNTGVFGPAADTWAVATNGSERVRVDSTGKVGIGTTAPGTLLHLVSSGDASLRIEGTGGAANDQSIHFKDTTSNWYVGNRYSGASPDNQSFGIGRTAAKDDFVITNSTGFFGIGKTAPAVFVDAVRSANDNLTRIRLVNSNSGASAQSRVDLGNDVNDSYAAISLNSSGNNTGPGSAGLSVSCTANLDLVSGNVQKMLFEGAGNRTIFKNSQIYIESSAIVSGAGTNALKYNTSTGVVTYDTSSRLIKESIVNNPYGLQTVLDLLPRKYHRTDDQKDEVGFVADEIATVIPEVVSYAPKSLFTKDENDTELVASSVAYDKLTSVLCKAIQELNAKVEALEAQVEMLQTQVALA